MSEASGHKSRPVCKRDRLAAYGVHVFTALGVAASAWMMASIAEGDYRTTFLLMVAAVVIDAVDGKLARRFRVKEVCPEIDGRKLDDIVDYLNYTFMPVLLLCRAGWLPWPSWAWAAVPLITSLFGFAHTGAKEEEAGFFRGFPSYWNIVVLYVALWLHAYGTTLVLGIVLGLSLLTVLPVRFVYPNRPPRWLPLFLGGAVAWLICLLAMIWQYPHVSPTLLAVSLVYPALYVILSAYLDIVRRRPRRRAAADEGVRG